MTLQEQFNNAKYKSEIGYIDDDGTLHHLKGFIKEDGKVVFGCLNTKNNKLVQVEIDITYGRLPWTNKKMEKESFERAINPENFDYSTLNRYFGHLKLQALIGNL